MTSFLLCIQEIIFHPFIKCSTSSKITSIKFNIISHDCQFLNPKAIIINSFGNFFHWRSLRSSQKLHYKAGSFNSVIFRSIGLLGILATPSRSKSVSFILFSPIGSPPIK